MEAHFRQVDGNGVTHSMRGYGKTSFTFAEEQRSRLYSLHLALVMNTECHYRSYDTDAVFGLFRQSMAAARQWLEAN